MTAVLTVLVPAESKDDRLKALRELGWQLGRSNFHTVTLHREFTSDVVAYAHGQKLFGHLSCVWGVESA